MTCLLSSPVQPVSSLFRQRISVVTRKLTVSESSHIFMQTPAHSFILHAVCFLSLPPFSGILKTGSQSCNVMNPMPKKQKSMPIISKRMFEPVNVFIHSVGLSGLGVKGVSSFSKSTSAIRAMGSSSRGPDNSTSNVDHRLAMQCLIITRFILVSWMESKLLRSMSQTSLDGMFNRALTVCFVRAVGPFGLSRPRSGEPNGHAPGCFLMSSPISNKSS